MNGKNKPQTRTLFMHRHIGPCESEITQMLASMGFDTLDAFIEKVLPSGLTQEHTLSIGDGCSEQEALIEIAALARENKVAKSFIGLGYHPTHTPPVIARHVLENPSWYTAYTPYQPEISQGRLEALLYFQQMVMDLTGMSLANASLLDEATAAAEAMMLAYRCHQNKRGKVFLVSPDVHPHIQDVVLERARYMGIEVCINEPQDADFTNIFGILLQYPTSTGALFDGADCTARLHQYGGICCVVADLLALTLLKPPGEWGADVVVGSSQRFGIPMGYGGPHAAFFATDERFRRAIPGRIIGISRDAHGEHALRMALQTREQHIRREKANSNICTAQALLANMATFFAMYHGPQGLQAIAQQIYTHTCNLAQGLLQKGYHLMHSTWFDTLTIDHLLNKADILKNAQGAGINLRCDQKDCLSVTLHEITSVDDITQLLALFPVLSNQDGLTTDEPMPKRLQRTSTYLQAPVFNQYHSETAMMRYLYQLARRDLTLAYGMIPLGSCTMKLNAVAEMMPLSWSGFQDIHPFVPVEQAKGYHRLIAQLSEWLCQITGMDTLCMQPNSGAQGEYAGLLCIRKYLQSIEQTQRDICLIPSSAHGTNPASAAMAGFDVKVVRCDKNGNIDLADVQEKIAGYGQRIACMMITYPSTHGVYEAKVRQLCQLLHDIGAQVYMDGANLNAQLGLMQPGFLGADVVHLNLHKTFAIPHGGGGPGMGPIAMKSHLTPFSPGHCFLADKPNAAVSAAPFGSASILTISWMYIRMLGAQGVTQATKVAIANANYIASALSDYYPILYRGQTGYVAHECILDIRGIKTQTGISELDIAKRLIDYGFHAPTMSFPVVGTLMIEPTESENKAELDRFIQAMIEIHQEITQIDQGIWPKDNNPLVNAPHTQQDLMMMDWPYPYDRKTAFFPVPGLEKNKFWPVVKRLNDVYGDRNFCCTTTVKPDCPVKSSVL